MDTPYSLYSSLHMDNYLNSIFLRNAVHVAWKIVMCFVNVFDAACETEIFLCLRIKQVYVKSLPKFPVLGQISSLIL